MKRFWTLGGGLSLSTLALLSYALGPGSEQLQTKQAVPAQIEAVYEDAIAQAEEAAKRQQFDRAIEIADGIPTNSRHAQTAQQLRESWSQSLLQQANAEYRAGNVRGAIAKLQPISQFNPLASQVASLRATWRAEAQQLNQVEKAIAGKNWTQALQAIEPLRGTELFSAPKVQALLNQALTNAFNTTAIAQLSAPPPITSFTPPVPIQISQPAVPTMTPPRLRAVAVQAEGALEASSPLATAATAPISVPSPPTSSSSSITLPPPPASISVAAANSPSSSIPSPSALTPSEQTEASNLASTSAEPQQLAVKSPPVTQEVESSSDQASSPETEPETTSNQPAQSISVPSPEQPIAQGNPSETISTIELPQLNQAIPASSTQIRQIAPTTPDQSATPENSEKAAPEQTVVVAAPLDTEILGKVTEVVRKQEAVALGIVNQD